tara:strand:- start:459 stop:884 length:426 start_codon:yes stop_codon:yes gene_type:complete
MPLELDKPIEELAYKVIGCAIEVHRVVGPGYLESVYENALAVELEKQGIVFERQYPVDIEYKGVNVGQGRIDLLVAGIIILELKVVDQLAPIHQAQVISYLKATDLQLGLLINFNTDVLKDGIKRIVLTSRSWRLGGYKNG